MDKFNKLAKLNNIVEARYKQMVVKRIRERYSQDDELAILRRRDTRPKEFEEYDAYVEECKAEVRRELGMGGNI